MFEATALIVRDKLFDRLENLVPSVTVNINEELYEVPLRWRRWFGKNYEHDTFKFVEEFVRPGCWFVDIGAHFGAVSIAAARRGANVIAFEPCPQTRTVFQRMLELNRIASVEVRPEAVCEKNGTSNLYVSSVSGDPANALVANEAHPMTVAVPVITLDRCVENKKVSIDCLKIDAEGAELDILIGAGRVLTQNRPEIFLSLHPLQLQRKRQSLEDIWETLSSHRFRPEYPKGVGVEQSWFCSRTELFDVYARPQ